MTEITWLGHSVFQFRLATGQVILTDPWITDQPHYPAGHQFDRIDTILVSHGHFDHINDVVPLAKAHGAKVIAIFEIAEWLKSKGLTNVQAMNKGGTVDAGPVRVTMTQALHSSCIVDDKKISVAGEPAGYIVHLPDGRRAYFAGDTAVFGDMQLLQALYGPDIALLPIGDVFTMGPREAAYACKLLGIKTVIPMHYGTFPALTGTPDQFAQELTGTDVRLLTLEPGKPVSL